MQKGDKVKIISNNKLLSYTIKDISENMISLGGTDTDFIAAVLIRDSKRAEGWRLFSEEKYFPNGESYQITFEKNTPITTMPRNFMTTTTKNLSGVYSNIPFK